MSETIQGLGIIFITLVILMVLIGSITSYTYIGYIGLFFLLLGVILYFIGSKLGDESAYA